jgi:hypothetical protein
MALMLLIVITASRLLSFFMSRYYGIPFKFGWIGATVFGGLTGIVGSFLLAWPDASGQGNIFAWLIFIPIFLASFLATMALDRPASRFVYAGLAWYIFVIAALSYVLAIRIHRGY